MKGLKMELENYEWNDESYRRYFNKLCELSDSAYKEFNSKLIPGTRHLIGIRTPILRKIAAQIMRGDYRGFIACKKGGYHEELMIEGMVLCLKKCPYDEMLVDMKYFTPKIYNWAICDTLKFNGIRGNREKFISDADFFLESGSDWQKRFGLGCLMQFFLDDEYIDAVLEKCAAVRSDFYYVKMMQAWLYATAAAKCRDKTMDFITAHDIDGEVLKMTAQKMRDSYRITAEDKELITKLRCSRL